jgi:hypothetical protein
MTSARCRDTARTSSVASDLIERDCVRMPLTIHCRGPTHSTAPPLKTAPRVK